MRFVCVRVSQIKGIKCNKNRIEYTMWIYCESNFRWNDLANCSIPASRHGYGLCKFISISGRLNLNLNRFRVCVCEICWNENKSKIEHICERGGVMWWKSFNEFVRSSAKTYLTFNLKDNVAPYLHIVISSHHSLFFSANYTS